MSKLSQTVGMRDALEFYAMFHLANREAGAAYMLITMFCVMLGMLFITQYLDLYYLSTHNH